MANKIERWSGDPSLLKEDHITALIIDFKKGTVETFVEKTHNFPTGGEYEPVGEPHPFTKVSPFGQISRGLRRMISNEYNRLK